MPYLAHKILGEIIWLLTIKKAEGATVVFNWDILVIQFQSTARPGAAVHQGHRQILAWNRKTGGNKEGAEGEHLKLVS